MTYGPAGRKIAEVHTYAKSQLAELATQADDTAPAPPPPDGRSS
ncbi:Uncharacterised protein [Mycobacterium tuberculosis]|nr:Uncharacterised protein [Mycobacterium tuberculosis]